MEILWVGTFGVFGVLCRYVMDRVIPFPGGNFPLATFIVNITGCIVMALLFRFHLPVRWSAFRVPLMVGFCGGFTTFSSYILQTAILWQRNPILSIGYLIGSIVVSLILVFLIIQL